MLLVNVLLGSLALLGKVVDHLKIFNGLFHLVIRGYPALNFGDLLQLLLSLVRIVPKVGVVRLFFLFLEPN